jgi:hypothetical protein
MAQNISNLACLIYSTRASSEPSYASADPEYRTRQKRGRHSAVHFVLKIKMEMPLSFSRVAVLQCISCMVTET